jgi:hypothetical protein
LAWRAALGISEAPKLKRRIDVTRDAMSVLFILAVVIALGAIWARLSGVWVGVSFVAVLSLLLLALVLHTGLVLSSLYHDRSAIRLWLSGKVREDQVFHPIEDRFIIAMSWLPVYTIEEAHDRSARRLRTIGLLSPPSVFAGSVAIAKAFKEIGIELPVPTILQFAQHLDFMALFIIVLCVFAFAIITIMSWRAEMRIFAVTKAAMKRSRLCGGDFQAARDALAVPIEKTEPSNQPMVLDTPI